MRRVSEKFPPKLLSNDKKKYGFQVSQERFNWIKNENVSPNLISTLKRKQFDSIEDIQANTRRFFKENFQECF